MSKLLINEHPLQVLPTLAKHIGLNEAIVLQQIHYWISNPRTGKEHEGKQWIYNSVRQWREDNFPFWSDATIKRTLSNLMDLKLIESVNLNKRQQDRTLWYTIDYKKLNELEFSIWSNCTNANGQNDQMQMVKMTQPLPETTTETKTDILSPTDSPDEENPEIVTDPKETTQQLMFGILCEVMKRDQKLEPGRTAAFAKKLIKAGYTHDEIDLFYSPGDNYYWKVYYKGKNGEPPNEKDITDTLVSSKEYKSDNIELSPEIEELENHFESLTGFFVLPYGIRRENEWIKPCQALLSRTPDLPAAKKLMSDALQFAREEKYTVKAPSSLLTIALNMNGSGSDNGAHAIDDDTGGFYV